jgi:predicted dehydrogenase
MSDSHTIRFGIVGTGLMAATMMECFALTARAKVVAVASADSQRAQAFAARFNIRAAHVDIAALLARDDVDAVYIANATRDHAATSLAALAASKAVLCEKQFALSEAQGLRVAAAAAAHQRLFMEAQWTPFLPAFAELRRLVDTRALGVPMHLYSEFGQSLDESGNERLFAGEGAGVLLDFGVYPIVLALQLLGPITSVRAALRYNAAGTDVQAALQLVHAGGEQSQLAVSLVAAMQNTSALNCSHGLAQLDAPVMGAESLQIRRTMPATAPRQTSYARSAKQRVFAALRQQAWVRRLMASRTRSQRSAHPYGGNRYLPQLLHFVALLDAGALTSDLMPIETSLDVLRVIDRARRDSPPPART